MRVFKTMLRLVRHTLIWLLGVYWIIFIGYTIKNLVAGGPDAVVAWYKHISRTSALSIHWDWRVFLARQIALVGVTLLLWFFGRPSRRVDSTVTR